jgi:hypothetical protein
MIESIDVLSRILSGTPLAARSMAELPIPGSPALALAIQIVPGELDLAWRTARGLLDTTGRWPVAVHCPAVTASWHEDMAEADFFNRFFYEEAENTADISPRGVLAAAATADVPAFLARLAEQDAENNPFSQDEIDYALELTRSRCDAAPGDAWLAGHASDDRFQFERLLFAWEQAHCAASALTVDTRYQDWMEEATFPSTLLLLPTPNSWDALAYVHYFGASPLGSEYYIALGRSWQQRFGAELVAHYGTMLQVVAARRPATPEYAMQLAREHDLAALDTLSRPGVSLRDHARYLLDHDRWFLHQRP